MSLKNDQSLRDFREFLLKNGKAPSTIDSYTRDAAHFLRFISSIKREICQIDNSVMTLFNEHLIESRHRPNSIRRKVIGTKQYFRYLTIQRKEDASSVEKALIPERVETKIPSFPSEFFPALLERVSPLPKIKMLRDRAILHLLALEGLKANEVINLLWKCYLSESWLGSLKIFGVKSRTIELHPETNSALLSYQQEFIAQRGHQPRERMMIAFKGQKSHIILPQLTRHGLKHFLYELEKNNRSQQMNSEILRHHAMEFQIFLGKSPEEIMTHLGLRQPGKLRKHLI